MSFLPLNRRDRGLDFRASMRGGLGNTILPGTLAHLFPTAAFIVRATVQHWPDRQGHNWAKSGCCCWKLT